jgi:hypothetical protein
VPEHARPLVRKPVNRSRLARASNDRVAQAAYQLRFVSRVPFLCECDDPSCDEIVLLELDEYEHARSERGRPITALGHTSLPAW